jgi:hypothetical protein
MPSSLIAVITGDLVRSTRHSADAVDAAMQAIRLTSDAIAGWYIPRKDTRFTRFRGDGWQIYLAKPRFSLRAAVVIQGTLMARNMESRISIGIGQSDSLGSTDLADAAGKAFEESGRGLDNMGDNFRLNISGEGVQPRDGIIADLLGERMQKWTAAQAEAAALQLGSPSKIRTLFDIGGELNISPQAVNDRVRGAGCATLASALQRWERLHGPHEQENSK